MKKLFAFLFAMTLLLSCICTLPQQTKAATEGDFSYDVYLDKATIIGYTGAGGDLTIPDTLGGYPVTAIENNVFHSCDSLTSVTFGSNLEAIGLAAFKQCDNLATVTIPANVQRIGLTAFSQCDNLTGIWVDENNPNYCSDDRGVLYTKSRAEIIQAPGAISGSYTIPDSVNTVGFYSFAHCKKLTEIIFPENLYTIKENAFFHCYGLTSVTIPESVHTIASNAFSSCSGLTGIWVEENNPNYASDDRGVLLNKQKTTLITAPGALSGSYTVPESVEKIQDFAFLDCAVLEEVTMGDHVQTIKGNAFTNCSGLTAITLSNSLTVIDSYTFTSCESLISITIPESVERIGDSVFNSCISLVEIAIPEGVERISEMTFLNCQSLRRVAIPESMQSIGESAFWGCNGLTDVYYAGSQEQWYQMIIVEGNEPLLNARIHFNSQMPDPDAIVPGDLDGVPGISEDDAIYLLQAILMPDQFPLNQEVDFDRNGTVNEDDAIYLLQHVLMPDAFPLPNDEEGSVYTPGSAVELINSVIY